MRDHSPNPQQAFTDGKVLEITNLGLWRKIYPEAVPPEALESFQSPFAPPGGRLSDAFFLRKLDDQTLLLRIPSFRHELRGKTDSILAANKVLLDSTPNLIIDVRGNGGGSDISYHQVLPYFYTNTISFSGIQHWATADNAMKYREMKADQHYPPSTRRLAERMEKKMLRREGHFIKTKDTHYKRKKVLPFPRKVAVLVNGDCASSCEDFVLAARQSKKVTVIGVNTAGILDYGNMHFMNYPCDKWRLGWATSRSNDVESGRGIDNTGIAPDVRPGPEATDWIDFARTYLTGKG
jgi:hypothetical protein